MNYLLRFFQVIFLINHHYSNFAAQAEAAKSKSEACVALASHTCHSFDSARIASSASSSQEPSLQGRSVFEQDQGHNDFLPRGIAVGAARQSKAVSPTALGVVRIGRTVPPTHHAGSHHIRHPNHLDGDKDMDMPIIMDMEAMGTQTK